MRRTREVDEKMKTFTEENKENEVFAKGERVHSAVSFVNLVTFCKIGVFCG